MTTIELPDDHPAVLAAAEERAAQLVPEPEPEDEGYHCSQCDEPMDEDNGMCEDCELEHVNPREWYRRHPEARR